MQAQPQTPGADQQRRQILASRRRRILQRIERHKDARGPQAQRPERVGPAALAGAALHHPGERHEDGHEERCGAPQRQHGPDHSRMKGAISRPIQPSG